MRRTQRHSQPRPLPVARICPGCNWDFLTGEGTKACGWFDCPYLSEELKVFCPACNYNFYTGNGAPGCGDPPECEWSVDGIARARRITAELGAPGQR